MVINNLRVSTWNVRGLHGKIIIRKVFDWLNKERVDLAMLQETHLNDEEHAGLRHRWIGQIYFSSFTTSSRGVAIVVNRNLPLKILNSTKDKRGCYIIVRGLLYGEHITFLNIYCPPNFSPEPLTKAFLDLLETASGTVIVGGILIVC